MFQLKWIWENMKGYRIRYVFAIITTIAMAFLQLVNPSITQRIIDEVVMVIPTVSDTTPLISLLIQLGIMIIVFTLFRTLLRYVSIIIYESCSQKFLFKMRKDLYKKLQKQDMTFFSNNRTGDLMTRLTGDLDMCRHTIAYVIRQLIDCFFLFLATTLFMLSKDVLFTLSLLAITPFLCIVVQVFSRKVGPLFVDLRERLSRLNSNVQENISGNKVVKAFAKEEYEINKFDEKNSDYKKANLKITMLWLKYFPAIEGLSQALSVAVLLVGGIFMINGRITAGVFMAFNSLCWTLIEPMRMLGMLLNDLQRFFASSNKIIDLYYTKTKIENPKNPITPPQRVKGDIVFDNVTIEMSEKSVLKNINLNIKSGQTVAIMGSTGSGKTTLINAIARFVDIKSGSLKIDGNEVKKLDLTYLRKNIGIANQDVFLFSDTIDGNIAYGNLDLKEEEVAHFADLAAADFVEKTKEGFDTIIGERGMGLSGGQKQRIALARALAVKPAILILDDTTSAVDMETEKYIQDSLDSLEFDCTKIIIAQRISSTKNADKIIILDKGEIIEEGTHEELLKQDGYYKDVFMLQNGMNEEGL